MNKQDIKLYEEYYYNTTGAYNKAISLQCIVIDIGINFIWIQCPGNLGPIFVKPEELSKQAKYKIITNHFKEEISISQYFK